MRLIASIAMAALLAVGATSARSHQAPSRWEYPPLCCSGIDCAQIEPEVVREIPAGFIVTIAPGGHPMWPSTRRSPLILEIPHEKVQQSPDGHWHLCINAVGGLLCFFAPAGDS